MCILKLHVWFFTGIGFILCIFNIDPIKNRQRFWKSISRHAQIVPMTNIRDHHPLSSWKALLKILHSPRASFLPHHPHSSGLKKVLMSRCSILESSWTVKVATFLLFKKGKQGVGSFSLSWLLCLSQWETVGLWSFFLHLREHLWSIKAAEHGRVPAVWIWPSANFLYQHTSPLKSCLKHCIPFPLTWFHLLSPLLSNRPLRAHIRHSVFTEIFFYNNCSVS